MVSFALHKEWTLGGNCWPVKDNKTIPLPFIKICLHSHLYNMLHNMCVLLAEIYSFAYNIKINLLVILPSFYFFLFFCHIIY